MNHQTWVAQYLLQQEAIVGKDSAAKSLKIHLYAWISLLSVRVNNTINIVFTH